MKSNKHWRDDEAPCRRSLAHRTAWKFLRRRRVLGYRFLRYYLLRGAIVVDFYCAELKLALEIDSPDDPSPDSGFTDEISRPFLNGMGITLITVSPAEVTLEFLEEIVIRHAQGIRAEGAETPPLDEKQRLG